MPQDKTPTRKPAAKKTSAATPKQPAAAPAPAKPASRSPAATAAAAKPAPAAKKVAAVAKAPAAATAKAPAAKAGTAVTGKAAVAKVIAKPAAPSPEERERWVAIAAYYRAEQRGFAPGYELEDWLEAEARVGSAIGNG